MANSSMNSAPPTTTTTATTSGDAAAYGSFILTKVFNINYPN